MHCNLPNHRIRHVIEGSRPSAAVTHGADERDLEARSHDTLAAETSGCLHFGFLHAAEVHRAASRLERELALSHRELDSTVKAAGV